MNKRKLFDQFDLYIPTKARDSAVEDLLATLTELSRGMTAASVQGGYVTTAGKVLLEGVVVYTFYSPDHDTTPSLQRLADSLAYHLLSNKGEESVLLVHDGYPYLYEEAA